MICVLVVASGASWESAALGVLQERPGVVVLKRCVDVDDLLASAAAGQADVAVVALDAPGLDVAAVDHLRRHRVRAVGVVPAALAEETARLRAGRIGIHMLVPATSLDQLADTVSALGADPGWGPGPSSGPSIELPPTIGREPGHAGGEPTADAGAPEEGRVIVVWGPQGAPGRTLLATSIAAELARRSMPTTLVDADPVGASVAQQLGILDEVSGLLSAARLAGSGELADRFVTVQRAVGPHLRVVTGLPRPDRWVEVRSGTVEHVLELARGVGHVVVDTGPSLEDDVAAELGSRPARQQMTLAAVESADELVVVGNADPVGLSRLARGLVELREVTGGVPVRVVVNRMRPTLGWAEREIAAMVEGFARLRGLHFLPDDRAAADRALVAGRSVVETGDSALAKGLAALTDALAPQSVGSHPGRRPGRRPSRGQPGGRAPLRRRTAGTARPR